MISALPVSQVTSHRYHLQLDAEAVIFPKNKEGEKHKQPIFISRWKPLVQHGFLASISGAQCRAPLWNTSAETNPEPFQLQKQIPMVCSRKTKRPAPKRFNPFLVQIANHLHYEGLARPRSTGRLRLPPGALCELTLT